MEIMSDLERAAAEYVRRQREHTAKEAEAAQAAARQRERGLRQGREFFAFARRHGAPVLRHYVEFELGDQPTYHRYKRTDQVAVVAAQWIEGNGDFNWNYGWAVMENGAVHHGVLRHGFTHEESRDVVDRQYFITRAHRMTRMDAPPALGVSPYDEFCDQHFPAVGAALLEPVQLAPGMKTGIQRNGWIGYRLLH
ncbi:hypothetical protein HS99_0008805 [Kitasatospora aureofaciens]|uniref:Uncharacterized protein n=2 Tax=Kitasatospora aureofaciens TaxID=1894 RepID=A0A1E7N1N7_KITAU|nr:hypothetical protein B6264_26990 [Kitasatospora aureofaciens]OEV34592.1 hypothetical protein HS99_0008805 [Kitasatospora aureofaciens]QEV03560.1 hypothetical protein CP971_34040 [Streptomyces viridifaciens]